MSCRISSLSRSRSGVTPRMMFFYLATNSRIKDVDVADESTQFARYNILVQAGTAMLAQANTSPQSALRLLG